MVNHLASDQVLRVRFPSPTPNIKYMETTIEDKVNHPKHYTSHPSGIECIQITRYYDFDIGNAIKYLWRAGLKKEEGYTDKNKEIEDLKKALYYINDKIKLLEQKN